MCGEIKLRLRTGLPVLCSWIPMTPVILPQAIAATTFGTWLFLYDIGCPSCGRAYVKACYVGLYWGWLWSPSVGLPFRPFGAQVFMNRGRMAKGEHFHAESFPLVCKQNVS